MSLRIAFRIPKALISLMIQAPNRVMQVHLLSVNEYPRYTSHMSLLVFDLDGTVVDTLPDITMCLNRTLTDAGKPSLTEHQVRPLIGGGLDAFLMDALDTTSDIAAFKDAYNNYYRRYLAEQSVLYPHVRTVIEKARSKDIKTAILTNKIEAHSRQLLEALHADSLFDAICGWDRYQVLKPDPQGLLTLIASLQETPDSTVMIGDGDTDVLVAQHAKVTSVAALYGYRDPQDLQDLSPDYTVSSAQDILSLGLF